MTRRREKVHGSSPVKLPRNSVSEAFGHGSASPPPLGGSPKRKSSPSSSSINRGSSPPPPESGAPTFSITKRHE